MSGNPAYGGMGMPKMLSVAFDEMLYVADSSFALYSALSSGACLAIDAHASDTLNHAGSDLGMIRTGAKAREDGSYSITGSKIFITGGEQDLTENIIHLVLAKLPGAPAGAKGISLFLMPKYLVNADGSLGVRNAVSCSSIEHKIRNAPQSVFIRFRNREGYSARIHQRLKSCGYDHWPTLEQLAAEFAINLSSLRRALEQIKDEMRRSIAFERLRTTSMSIAEIAQEAGFREPSAFHRAFKQWTGESPGAFRHRR